MQWEKSPGSKILKRKFELWHHGPRHLFLSAYPYMVTAGTVDKRHFFRGDDRLLYLEESLKTVTLQFGWTLDVWSVFPNHYHFIAWPPADSKTLKLMIQELHRRTSIEVNRLDHAQGRQVWFQYWDTCITFEKSYYARLNYVNNNAVHHGLVKIASQYPYCSAARFEREAEPRFRRKVQTFRYDKLKIEDDY